MFVSGQATSPGLTSQQFCSCITSFLLPINWLLQLVGPRRREEEREEEVEEEEEEDEEEDDEEEEKGEDEGRTTFLWLGACVKLASPHPDPHLSPEESTK